MSEQHTTNAAAGKGKWEVLTASIGGEAVTYVHHNFIHRFRVDDPQLAAEVRDALNGYEAVREAAQAVIDNPSCADPDCCPAAYAHELALHQLKALLTPPQPPTPEQQEVAHG